MNSEIHYPLTKSQELVYNMDRFAGGNIAVICGSMLLPRRESLQELERVAFRILELNQALRIRLHDNRDRIPVQIIAELKALSFSVLHFADKDELDHYGAHWAREPLPLDGPLCEICIVLLPESSGFLIKLHHLIGDAWTLSLLGSQINHLLRGEEPTAYPYTDYIAAEESYRQSKRYERDRSFFDAQFQKCDEVTYFSEKQNTGFTSERKSYVIEKDGSAKILAYTNQEGTSAFMLFLGTLAVYLSRIKMNAERFYIGTTVLNRNGNKEKNTAGMFIHTIPLLIELDSCASFRENLSAVEDMVFSSFRHQKFNYGDTLSMLREKYHFSEQLYDISLSYQNASIAGVGEGIASTWYHCGMQTESLQIHIEDRDSEGIFHIHYDYLTEKFTPAQIDAMHQRLLTLLFDAIDTGNSPGMLRLMPEPEKQKVLTVFNDTSRKYPGDRCLHHLFEELVAQDPHRPAVLDCDGTLTLRELDDEANRIAGGLMEAGVLPGDIVAFALPRRNHMISTMLGILKAGAAYLPIDQAYPAERIALLLSESRAAYFVTAENIQQLLSAQAASRFPAVGPEALCYCISTSGSTGTPKIVQIRHRNIINTICWKKEATNSEPFTTLCISASTADTFTEDVLFSLLAGRPLRLCDREKLPEVAALIAGNPNCAIMTTPTLFNSLWSLLRKEDRLREVTLVGESLSTRFVQQIAGQVDTIYNEYGPSECAVCATRALVRADDEEITIGRPISNAQIYIVDKALQPLPVGVTGELCIAGHGVGNGYLHQDSLTTAAFVDNPFGLGKLYKTGDLAYWREDGNIMYVGRNDFQVKIRGLRIELEEIENVICSVPGIFESVVVVRKDETGRQVICAFYSEIAPVDVAMIKQAILRKLPRYMLPHIFTRLDTLPTTASGKVNRKALPEVDLHAIARATVYEKPQGVREQQLAAIWEEVMEYSPAGRKDNFFDVGGDSLKAIELISRTQSAGLYISLQAVFDHPTIEALCQHLAELDGQPESWVPEDFAAVHDVLSGNKLHSRKTTRRINLGDVLFAGATGFLGIHLLADFLEKDSGTAYCLVRGESDAQCLLRFRSLLEHYFGNTYSDLIGTRIRIIRADLQHEHFGLTAETYTELAGKIQTVINAAASVKHYGSYDYFYDVNVATVRRLIDFARSANARLIHTSTLSVSGNGFGSDPGMEAAVFTEQNLYIGQSLDNVYVRSKFEAEKALLDAHLQGLPIYIMRMGNLTNRRSDAVFQKNYESNAFANRMKGILEFGVFPDYLQDMQIEFTPVDDAASAVMTLARHFDPKYTVFHICNPHPLSMEMLAQYFDQSGCPVHSVPGEKFAALLQQAAQQETLSQVMTAFVNDMDENYHLHYESNIHVDSSFTTSQLKACDFCWEPIGCDYIGAYISYFHKNGFFEVSL